MTGDRVPARAAFASAFCAAATYVHFLIFAEFALLEIAADVNGTATPVQRDMLPLIAFGIIGAFVSAALAAADRTRSLLASGFAVCASASVAAALAHTPLVVWIATALAGGGLGFTTVTLAGSAHRLFAGRRIGLWLGVATGFAYAFCNLPVVFATAPRTQAIIATVVALVAAGAAWLVDARREPARSNAASRSGFWAGVAVLFALVWFDSAAFFLIQHDTGLKSVSWGNDTQLWINASGHLVAAMVAGILVDAGRTRISLALAGTLLAGAVLGLQVMGGASSVAHVLYPVGVSLYSVPLITLPALTRGVRSPATSSMRAAILYAVSGWIASAVGIGTALHSGKVALVPAAIAGAIFCAFLLWSKPWRAIVAGVTILAFAIPVRVARAAVVPDPVAEGRRVYIAEGCIHCHSQFVRPGTQDETTWGPAAPLDSLLAAAPPLPGNRRQGPDLQNVGLRRSPEWNRLHLMDPRAITPGSRMPSYAYLFDGAGRRGTALVSYLASLGTASWETRSAEVSAWQPGPLPRDTARGRALFARLCAPCHGDAGRGDGPVAASLNSKPRDLTAADWRMLHPGDDAALARVIKFGVPGTSMAGHESLPDGDIAALTAFVLSLKIH